MSTKHNSASRRRDEILRVLEEAGTALQIRDIVERTGLDYDNARSALSEMTTLKLLARVDRGVYDLPGRVPDRKKSAASGAFKRILSNQQILKVLLNIVITNKALMEALLLGQQEIIKTLRGLNASPEGQDAIDSLEKRFAERVDWHFNSAAQRVVEQYTKLPPEVLDVLVAPLARDTEHVDLPEAPRKEKRRSRADRSASKNAG